MINSEETLSLGKYKQWCPHGCGKTVNYLHTTTNQKGTRYGKYFCFVCDNTFTKHLINNPELLFAKETHNLNSTEYTIRE